MGSICLVFAPCSPTVRCSPAPWALVLTLLPPPVLLVAVDGGDIEEGFETWLVLVLVMDWFSVAETLVDEVKAIVNVEVGFDVAVELNVVEEEDVTFKLLLEVVI